MSPRETRPAEPLAKLTGAKPRSLKPKSKLYRVADGGGLNIEVQSTSARCWRYRNRFAGKQRVLKCGVYPTVSLVEARCRREGARKMLIAGPHDTSSKS